MDKKEGIQPFNIIQLFYHSFYPQSESCVGTQQLVVFSYFHPFVKAAAEGMSMEEGVLYAWRVGCVANLVSGIIATLHLGSEDVFFLSLDRFHDLTSDNFWIVCDDFLFRLFLENIPVTYKLCSHCWAFCLKLASRTVTLRFKG